MKQLSYTQKIWMVHLPLRHGAHLSLRFSMASLSVVMTSVKNLVVLVVTTSNEKQPTIS